MPRKKTKELPGGDEIFSETTMENGYEKGAEETSEYVVPSYLEEPEQDDASPEPDSSESELAGGLEYQSLPSQIEPKDGIEPPLSGYGGVFGYLPAPSDNGSDTEEQPVSFDLPPEASFGLPPEVSEDAPPDIILPDAPEEPEPAASAPVRAAAPVSPAMTKRREFYSLDLKKLDGGLTSEEAREWNNIYASYRSRSILSGMVIGVDQNRFAVSGGASGESRIAHIRSLVVIDYRIKVLIPETELWAPNDERPQYVLPNMVGGSVDYVILEVDREGGCAVGSRRMALSVKRHGFSRAERREGETLTCKVVAVGPKVCTIECGGYDIQLTQRDLTYTATPDLREKYRPGMELACVLKSYDKKADKLVISVKDTMPNPFDGADIRHPVRSRRQAVISGKYRGGVFCTLPDGTVCHCLYSSRHSDSDFRDGDSVIIVITEYNYDRRQIFGRILTKWQ